MVKLESEKIQTEKS